MAAAPLALPRLGFLRRGRPILMRIAQAIPVVVGVVVISFVLTRALPGDPAVYFAGPAADEASIAQIRTALGLDKPLPVQFAIYVQELATGNLGNSLTTGQPVVEDLARRLPASLELTLAALLLSCAIAVPLGVLAATRPGSCPPRRCATSCRGCSARSARSAPPWSRAGPTCSASDAPSNANLTCWSPPPDGCSITCATRP